MAKESTEDIVQINLRLPRGKLEELDSWVEELNRGRRLGKATRNAVLLSLLELGLTERPDLEAPAPKPSAQKAKR